MEVSSHALIEGRVHGCDYDIAVFTNFTQDHLIFIKQWKNIVMQKGYCFRNWKCFKEQNPKYAVLNADDETYERYKEMTAARVITYGIDQEADFRAKNIT